MKPVIKIYKEHRITTPIVTVDHENVIQRMMVISSIHISDDTYEWLRQEVEAGVSGLIAYAKSEYGFTILVLDDPDEDNPLILPEDLMRVYRFAQATGVQWLMFDHDAYAIAELPMIMG
jgi:hypothetical protein